MTREQTLAQVAAWLADGAIIAWDRHDPALLTLYVTPRGDKSPIVPHAFGPADTREAACVERIKSLEAHRVAHQS